MPMRASTIRFSERMWTVIAQEAEAEGITVALFIREAAISRAIWMRCARGEIDGSLESIDKEIRRLRDED